MRLLGSVAAKLIVTPHCIKLQSFDPGSMPVHNALPLYSVNEYHDRMDDYSLHIVTCS